MVMSFSSLFMTGLKTIMDCSWEEVEILPLEISSTLTLCLRMEAKLVSWSHKVFVSLPEFEDMAACCSISAFKLSTVWLF